MDRMQQAEQLFDVRAQVEHHPWLWIGGSALAGLAVGVAVASLSSQRTSTEGQGRQRPDSETSGGARPSSTTGQRSGDYRPQAQSLSGESRSQGGLGELAVKMLPGGSVLGTLSWLEREFEPEIREVKGMAVGALGNLALNWLQQSAPQEWSGTIQHLVDDLTTKMGGKPMRHPGGGRSVGGQSGGGQSSGGQGGSSRQGSLSARDLMTRDPAWCTKDTSLIDVARMMRDHHCGALPVFESRANQRLVGVITDRDIVSRTLANGQDPYQMAAGDCMSPDAVTVTPDTSLEECARAMAQNQIRRLVVVDRSGRILGIIAQADLARQAPEQETGRVVRGVSQPAGAR